MHFTRTPRRAVTPLSRTDGVLSLSLHAASLVFAQCAAAGWPNGHFVGGGDYGVAACPAHRPREVEMHHVDLGLGYTSLDWPDEYVAWDLTVLLATAADRIGTSRHRRLFMAG